MINKNSILKSLSQLNDKLKQAQNCLNNNSDTIVHKLLDQAIIEFEILHNQVTQWQSLESQIADITRLNAQSLSLNREQFKQQLTKAINDVVLNQSQYALCYFDIDQFRVINDSCGHLAGEKLLHYFSILLPKKLQKQNIIAYLGGDEFGFLLQDCTLSQAQEIAETLRQEIEVFPFAWQDKILNITISMGLVMIDNHTPNWSYVLSAAEAACQTAKQRGGNRLIVYRFNDRELLQQRSEREWVLRLNQALKDNRFFLYAQRIAPIHPNSGVDHYEILLRLLDETGQPVTPGVFIPVAERYNLMPAIDRWVIRQFFQTYEGYYLSQSSSQSHPCLYTINLSAASINNEQFLGFLQQQILSHKIPANTLCFEITETAAIANLGQAEYFIRAIKNLGCQFALDDFGTGMSSLAYLKSLPVDYLKIDGSFVKNIVENPVDYVIVECFNQIGHAMEMKTIAEFVEEDAILEKLKSLGVDYAQGYSIGHPSPLSFNAAN